MKLMAGLKKGQAPQLLLLFGDDLQVQETCKAVLDHVVPEERREFNFERFDGRAASWEQIEASLMTPPFLPGKKLLWVENAPYFFSREQKGEFGEKILELWRAGKRDDAVKLLIDLLILEGWTQEQWERLDASSSRALLDLLDVDSSDAREDVDALVAHCKSRDLDLSKRRAGEGHRLVSVLERGLPEWSFLLLTAVQVDRRTRLYKRFEELGAVVYLGLERDRSGKISRENLLEFVTDRLRQTGKNLHPQARETILARAGDDLRGLHQELDKLLLFVGDRQSIRTEDVEAIFADQGQGWIFDLTRAIADRDANAALTQLARLLGQGEHPLKILATVTAEVRRLLFARQLLETELAKLWKRGMNYQQFQQTVLKPGRPLLTRNPYADYMCFQRAEHFSLDELTRSLEGLFDSDLRLKSTGSQPRLVLERWILGMCLGSPQKSPRRERGAL
ncbi:MAG TPA: DNA polymerase III subunit delta [Verrucomicrobiae bacterium]|nr:DNA polymerase III subunit delta [Verrucomicrobiae bacterium]